MIEDEKIICIAHNVKYEIKMLYHNIGILLTNVFCTMIAETLQFAGVSKPYYSLQEVAFKYLGMTLKKGVREEFEGKTDFNFTDAQIEYAATDATVLLPICEAQAKLLAKNQGEDVWDLEMKLVPVVAMMEYTGVLLDANTWRDLARASEQRAEDCALTIKSYLAKNFKKLAGTYSNGLEAATNLQMPVKQMRKARKETLEALTSPDEILNVLVPEINLNSSKQARYILNKLGVKTKSSSQKELQKFKGHEFIDMLLAYRKAVKAGSSFGDEFILAINPVSGRIHSEFNQVRAATGRFGSSGPNLQNIIALLKYRKCFLARDGHKLATSDYSQIELRIMAEVSGEPLMIQAFKDGEDLHRLTASIIFEVPLGKVTATNRKRAKNVNFAVIYGTTAWGLRYNFGWPIDVGQEYLNRFFSEYTRLKEFIWGFGRKVVEHSFSTTLYGRKRYFNIPHFISRKEEGLIKKIKRQGVNHIIQGSSADMIKLGMVLMFYNNPFDKDFTHPNNFRFLMTVHDEVVIEYREDLEAEVEEFIGTMMVEASKPFLTEVPVEFDIKKEKYWSK
jgi:DNA polymerase I-like protein with 3'-5' exonuclease and polymerase domains